MKRAALEAINGTDNDSYNALPKYCNVLSCNNPDSTIVLECTSEEGNSRFQHMFVCYATSAIRFSYCPPSPWSRWNLPQDEIQGYPSHRYQYRCQWIVISLGICCCWCREWQQLVLVYPVIEQHTPWFLAPQALTFVSDRQKGLLEGVANVFPDSPHGYCLRHLYEDMWKNFKHPKHKTFLWQALLAHAHPRYWVELYFPE